VLPYVPAGTYSTQRNNSKVVGTHLFEENLELVKEKLWVSYAKRNSCGVLALLVLSDFHILHATITQINANTLNVSQFLDSAQRKFSPCPSKRFTNDHARF
jgi:hypothetical protein